MATRPAGGYWPLPSPTVLISGIASAIPLFYGMYLIRRAGRALPPCRRRRQLSWAFAALVLGTLGGLDLNTVFTRTYPMGWAWCALSSVTLFYAIAQHRLMATRTFIRQALLGTVGVGAGAIIVSFVVVVTPDALSEGGWPLAGATLVMFLAVRVWTSVVEPSLSYLFGWRRRRIERAFADFERHSLDARSTDEVTLCLADALKDAFDASLVRMLPAERDRKSEHPSIAVAEEALRELGAPILRDLVDLDDARAPRLLDALDRLGADALVPLSRDDTVQAVAVLARRRALARRRRRSPTSCAASAIAPRSPGSTRASTTKSRAARPASRRRSACAPPSSKRRSPNCARPRRASSKPSAARRWACSSPACRTRSTTRSTSSTPTCRR